MFKNIFNNKKILIGFGVGTIAIGTTIGVAIPLATKQKQKTIDVVTKEKTIGKYGKGIISKPEGDGVDYSIYDGYISKKEFFDVVKRIYAYNEKYDWEQDFLLNFYETSNDGRKIRVIGWIGAVRPRQIEAMTLEEYKVYWINLIKNNGEGVGRIVKNEGQKLTDWIDIEDNWP